MVSWWSAVSVPAIDKACTHTARQNDWKVQLQILPFPFQCTWWHHVQCSPCTRPSIVSCNSFFFLWLNRGRKKHGTRLPDIWQALRASFIILHCVTTIGASQAEPCLFIVRWTIPDSAAPHAAGGCPCARCFLAMLKILDANLRFKSSLVEAELISHYCALVVGTPPIGTLTPRQSCKTSPLVCLFVKELFSHALIKTLPSFSNNFYFIRYNNDREFLSICLSPFFFFFFLIYLNSYLLPLNLLSGQKKFMVWGVQRNRNIFVMAVMWYGSVSAGGDTLHRGEFASVIKKK